MELKGKIQELSESLKRVQTRFVLPVLSNGTPSIELFQVCNEELLGVCAQVAALEEAIEREYLFFDEPPLSTFCDPSHEAIQFIQITEELSQDVGRSHLLIEDIHQQLRVLKRLAEQSFILNDFVSSVLLCLRSLSLIIIGQLGILIVIGLFLLKSL